MQSHKVVSLIDGVCDNIIQVDQTVIEIEFPETILYKSLRCIVEAKWHVLAVKKAEVLNGEGSVLLWFWAHYYLPEPPFEV